MIVWRQCLGHRSGVVFTLPELHIPLRNRSFSTESIDNVRRARKPWCGWAVIYDDHFSVFQSRMEGGALKMGR